MSALPRRYSNIGWIVAGLLAMFVCAVARADVTGEAEVTDGDSLRIAGQRVRLHGIDAPELHQTCKDVCAAVTKSSTGAAAMCSRGGVKSSQ